MSKLHSHDEILLHLPVDETLKLFIEFHGIQWPKKWGWHESIQTSTRLIELIANYPQTVVRTRIVTALQECEKLRAELGREAMFQVVKEQPVAFSGLMTCKSDLHRALWLYVHKPQLFEQASSIKFLDHFAHQAQQHDLGLKRLVRRDNDSITAFEDAISRFYQRELGCGEVCIANVLERS